LISDTDCDTGVFEIDKKIQYVFLYQIFEFQHIFINNILRKKSDNQSYLYAEFVKNCFKKKIDISRKLKINLFEKKINKKIEKNRK